jgi:hypothetical protein
MPSASPTKTFVRDVLLEKYKVDRMTIGDWEAGRIRRDPIANRQSTIQNRM